MKITLNPKTSVEKKTYRLSDLTEGLYIPFINSDTRIYVNKWNVPAFFINLHFNYIEPVKPHSWKNDDLFYKDESTSEINIKF